jgi:paraquat-inducible protein B
MSEPTDTSALPEARVTHGRSRRISVVWLIPILAAVVAVGIAINRIMNEGPTITIVFRSAAGLEPGKTTIQYKDVKIGQVTSVDLSKDYSRVVVRARMAKVAAGLMVEDARFWIVEPRVTLSGISGLGTLLSGNYIGFEPGKSKKEHHEFTALDVPPVVTMDQPGTRFVLKVDTLGSLGVGSPIYYRHIAAGQVVAYGLTPDGKSLQVDFFVSAPYDRYVSRDTRFWNASGVDVSVGAEGVNVRTESLAALLAGGIAFETPPYATGDPPADAGTTFVLYPDRKTAMKQPDRYARPFVLYFDESLKGLSVGAPVLLLGLPAGEVTDVSLEMDPASKTPLRGRVQIVAYPERVIGNLRGTDVAKGRQIVTSDKSRIALLETLIGADGMRAQLRTGNLLTGERYVALDFFPAAPKARVDWKTAAPVMPTMPSTMPEVQAKIGSILAKIDAIPFEAIGTDFKKTLVIVNRLLEHADTELTPELKSTLVDLRTALAKADKLMEDTNASTLAPDAPTQLALRQALDEISAAARSLRVLSDYLERHPEALIKGKD